MLIPIAVREAVQSWTTDPSETIPAMQRVRVPVLITQGRQDAVVAPRTAELVKKHIRHAEISWYDDCGHSPFQEDAPRFNAELAAFAKRVFTAPAG